LAAPLAWETQWTGESRLLGHTKIEIEGIGYIENPPVDEPNDTNRI